MRLLGLALLASVLACGPATVAGDGTAAPTRSLNPGERIGQFLAGHTLDPVETNEPRTASPTPARTAAPTRTTAPTLAPIIAAPIFTATPFACPTDSPDGGHFSCHTLIPCTLSATQLAAKLYAREHEIAYYDACQNKFIYP